VEYLSHSVCAVEFRLLCMMSGASLLISGAVIALLTR
jgi:hypothetical protein